ncbi:MAG TPA: asparagine synthase (glutamine-hydrolyzing) [Candidatus Saccharimonadales bacterium]|nr:asparagine synthase (glutamine-hydrolyzing) [Candidatus Saccharimonadales bacterium]
MCSILAMVNEQGLPHPLRLLTSKVLEQTRARGPDDSHAELINNIAYLGSNRLSIIGLGPAGRMPIKSQEHNCWIVYNGELYNHRELRAELKGQGFRFSTQSDTEVVLNAYVQWGDSFIEKLNGIFAFVIFDQDKARIIAGRDRFGAKPLYYMEIDGTLILSSDFKPLKQLRRSASDDFDAGALTAYMHFRFIPGNRSILKGIFKLKPAEIITWHMPGLKRHSRTYWRPYFRPEPFRQKDFTDKFLQAMQYVSVADVKPDLLLSGGLDSSAVAAAMHHLKYHAIHSYSCTYKDQLTTAVTNDANDYSNLTNPYIDESQFAKLVVQTYGHQHHTAAVNADITPENFADMQRALGEPLASTDALGHYLFASALKGKTKLVLAGTGSDEILGGYEQLYFKKGNPKLRSFKDPLQLLRIFTNMDGDDELPLRFLNPDIVDNDYTHSLVSDVMDRFPADKHEYEALNQLAFFELGFDLPGWELDQADRIYMDQSIELRPAFLENNLVDYALTIRSRDKRGKAPLKQAMRGLLPDTIIDRPKYPSLGTPRTMYQKAWFQEGLRSLFEHPLDIWNRSEIQRLARLRPEDLNFDILYRLVYLQTWQHNLRDLAEAT